MVYGFDCNVWDVATVRISHRTLIGSKRRIAKFDMLDKDGEVVGTITVFGEVDSTEPIAIRFKEDS